MVEVEPLHLDRLFDYRVPDEPEAPVQVGSRVEVVFGGRRRRGLVVELTDHTDVAPGRIRELRRVFGPHAWATAGDIELFRWAADRYGAPMADVVRHALPPRTVAVERAGAEAGWFPRAERPHSPDPGPDGPGPWARYDHGGAALAAAARAGEGAFVWRPLPDEDVAAAVADLVRRCVAGGRDAVVVVPDPASRLADRLVAGLVDVLGPDLIVDGRGGLGPRARYRRWLQARCGAARVVIGERGVAFWPVDRLGLTVVVDEANPAHKERRSPRHHVRELLLERARRADGVGLAITTVPSAPAWRLLRARRLTPVTAERATEVRAAPRVVVDDDAGGPRTRLGRHALPALRHAVDHGGYGVVLAARRGEGTALACGRCGHRLRCPTCSGSLARDGRRLTCRTCGWGGPSRSCPECGHREYVPLAAGAERLGEELTRAVTVPVAVLEGHDAPVPPPPAVLVTTRGSVLDEPPGPVGAVVIADLDTLVRRPAVDAPEDALRLAMALATWVARSDGDGPVIAHTGEPDGPVPTALRRWDPGGFWRAEAPRRAELHFPPDTTAIAVRVGGDPGPAAEVLAGVLPFGRVLGPVREPDGLHRFLLLADDRAGVLAALRPWREEAGRAGHDVRVDVEPVDL